MLYPNLHTAVKSLGHKLYSFAGHHIAPTHTAYCFNQMARAIDHIRNERAAVSVNFDGEIYIDGRAMPVIVSVQGADIFGSVDVAIMLSDN